MKKLSLFALTILFMAHPLLGQRRELVQLQADIVRLTAQVSEIQNSLDERNKVVQDLVEQHYDRVIALAQTVQRLTETLNDVQASHDRLSGEMRVLMLNLRNDVEMMNRSLGGLRTGVNGMSQQLTAMGRTTEQLESPAGLMRLAVTDFLAGNYELALEGFREYLDSYPSSIRAAEAQLYMGDVHFTKRAFDQAIIEYDFLLQKYPDSAKRVTALYKKGLALGKLKQTGEALTYLRQVVSDFPDSTEAASARQAIDDLGGHF